MNIRTKLTILLLSICIGVIAAIAVLSTIALDDYFRSRIISELKTQANQVEFYVRTSITSDTAGYQTLQGLARSANFRLTLIDQDGRVRFESDLPYSQLHTLENHRNRFEIQQAANEGFGIGTRHSATLNADLLYVATRIDTPFPELSGFSDATFLRIAVPLTQVNEVKKDIRNKIALTSVCVLVVVIVVTVFASKRFAQPIREMAIIADQIRSGDLQKRIPIQSFDEFGKLAETLNNMVDKLGEDIEKLKKLERVRSEFLGNVSHELRTPIFAIQGMLETLLSGALDDKEVNRTFVQRALHNTQRLNALLGDLIEISRIESGEMKLSFRYFSVNEFLDQLMSELQPLAQQKRITLSLDAPASTVDVLGDKERLKQAMVNLIDNAIKYTNPQGLVNVSCVQTNNTVRISVRDTGVGISVEHLLRIFERFYRVDKERSREGGGTGLGLAIVKHIIEAHGSKVDVQSEIGRGSVFSFLLKA